MDLPYTSRLKIFTWHIHGSYLYYLSLGNYDIYIPTKDTKVEGYYGRGETFPFGKNIIEVPVEEIGKNSVSPSTNARMMACSIVMIQDSSLGCGQIQLLLCVS